MRSLFMLMLGGVCGVIATVLLFTLDTTFDSDPDEAAGGGNARLVFDEPGLEALIRSEIEALDGFGAINVVNVEVREEGLMVVELGAGAGGLAITGDLVLTPNIDDGRLRLDVVEARLGSLGVPDPLVRVIEERLTASLDNLDPGVDYTLVAITTTDRELSLEIEL